jgi:peptide/nickel transport system substrate-binding protein
MMRLLAVATAATLVVAGCSTGTQSTPSAGGNAELGTTSDINPQDPANLAQGGALRLAISAFPDNFNTLNIDGNSADTSGVLRPTMPRGQ